MIVYRIAQTAIRVQDLSGFGAFKYGGRWNNKGTPMLYTSINSSLAYLESLVHFDEAMSPPHLYVASIEIKDEHLIYELPENKYPHDWQVQDSPDNKLMGDKWIAQNKYLAIKVRSAVNPMEYNFLLNPDHPGYADKVIITNVRKLNIDSRLIR